METSDLLGSEQLSIMPLGAGAEVGRSCIVVKFKGKNIMLDCGIHPAYSGMAALPFFDEVDPESIDLVLITHFHLDHAASLPFFMEKTNYKGPVYMTHPTKAIYKWLLADYVKVSTVATASAPSSAESGQLYTENDLIKSYERITAIDYHQEVEYNGIKFTALNAGHVLGAAMFSIEIAGVRILYTGDYSREEDRHLMAAETPQKKPDVMICESTYGVHSHQPRLERESRFTSLVHQIVSRGGRCLIPVFALGRAQELLLILDEYWQANPELQEIPVYYASALAKKCMTVYQTYVNMMNDRIRRQISINNPFIFRHVKNLRSMEHFKDDGPCVMMASPGMLQNGLSRELLEKWAPHPRNGLIIPGYVVEGTLAKLVLSEPKEFPAMKQNTSSTLTVPLKMSVEYISFSAHVDFGQNSDFIEMLRPSQLILVHGESGEMLRLRSALLHKHFLNDKLCSQPSNYLIGNVINDGDGGDGVGDNGSERRLLNVHCPRNCEPVDMRFRGEKFIKIVGSMVSDLSGRNTAANINDDATASTDNDGCNGDEIVNGSKCDVSVVKGVLVGKDFEYQLMNKEDLQSYTSSTGGLCSVELEEEQIVRCRAPITLIEWSLSQLYGKDSVRRLAAGLSYDIVLLDKFTISPVVLSSSQADQKEDSKSKAVFEYSIRWSGNPMNDIVADSVVMLILGVESSKAAVKVTNSGGSTCSHGKDKGKNVDNHHDCDGENLKNLSDVDLKNSLIKEFLKDQLGELKATKDSWSFDVDGTLLSVNTMDYSVVCEDKAILTKVKKMITRISSMVDADVVI